MRVTPSVVKRAWLTPRNGAKSRSYRADRRRTRAPINTRVLQRGTGIPSRTLQYFLTRFGDLSDPEGLARGRAEYGRGVLAVDEAAMIDTVRMEELLRIAARLGVARVALVGDTEQLRPVDAGQPFRLLQKAGMATATMDEVVGAFWSPSRKCYTAPSITTFHKILAALPPETLDNAIGQWTAQQSTSHAPVALDGKDLRGASAQTENGRRMMVAAVEHDSGLVLGQVEVDSKSNEIPAVRALSSNLAGSEADATRLRLTLEGSRRFETGAGSLTPRLEVGLRHDGSDAETGSGVEVGASVRYEGAGVSAEGSVRTLVAHEAEGYEEWGASGALRIDPGESGRGLSLTLAPTWGAAAGGVERLWSVADPRGLAPGGAFEAGRRLEAELGYGFALGSGRYTGTPKLGLGLADEAREVRLGWRLAEARRSGLVFGLDVEGGRHGKRGPGSCRHDC